MSPSWIPGVGIGSEDSGFLLSSEKIESRTSQRIFLEAGAGPVDGALSLVGASEFTVEVEGISFVGSLCSASRRHLPQGVYQSPVISQIQRYRSLVNSR